MSYNRLLLFNKQWVKIMSHHMPSHADAHRTLSGRQINANDSSGVIVNPNEIIKKLVYLLSKNILLVISAGNGSSSVNLLTTITHIDGGYIFFGGFQNEKRNSDLLNNSELIVSADDTEDASVRFKISGLSGHGTDTEFAFKARIPPALPWIQRRNARRVKVPANAPIKIQYKNNTKYFDVLDISVTGLSYIDKTADHCFSSVGERHTDCSIVMPDKSIIMECFEIANSSTAFSYLRHDQWFPVSLILRCNTLLIKLI